MDFIHSTNIVDRSLIVLFFGLFLLFFGLFFRCLPHHPLEIFLLTPLLRSSVNEPLATNRAGNQRVEQMNV